LIGEDGEQLGVVPLAKALAVAEEAGLDLVEIAPMANPPVCKVMDYGKYRYQEQKKAQEARLKQKQIQVKEIKLRPGTDENDYQIKLRNLRRSSKRGTRPKSRCASAGGSCHTRSWACASSSVSARIWPTSAWSSRCPGSKGGRW